MAARTGTEPLTAADASQVVLDAADQVNVFLLAGLLGSGGFVGDEGDVDLDRVRADLAARLHDPGVPELARFRQRVGTRDGRLVWETCEPDLGWHVRLVEPVTGLAGVAELCAGLMVEPLPSDRPGWELLVVPGAAQEGPGVVFRAHHAIADGVAGVRLAELLFSPSPPAPVAPRPSGPAGAAPPRHRWRGAVQGALRMAAILRRSVPRTVLLGPIGQHRGVGFAEVDLAALSQAAHRAGGTVNDALLAGVAAGASAGLRERGQPVPSTLPASVPVALPDRGGSGNAVGVMVVPLPTDQSDARSRLALIAQRTSAMKAEARAAGTLELTRSRLGARVFGAIARRQRMVVAFVTNVRGPAAPLLVGGAPLLRAWPVTPIQGNVRLGIAALSYRGRLACAVHTDAEVLDATVIAAELQAEFAALMRDPGAQVGAAGLA